MKKEIKQLIIDYRTEDGIVDSKNGKIERFEKNGEMAHIDWFRQGKQEFNGKYVISIIYK